MSIRYKLALIFLITLIFCENRALTAVSINEQNNSFKIAIFKEDGFPYVGTPEEFSAEWVGRILAEEYDIVYLNTEKLKDESLLNINRIDLLILPYGEAVPEGGLPTIVKFIKEGGGLFTTAGRPFRYILMKGDKSWEKINSSKTEKYISSLGLNSYIIYSKDIAAIKATSEIFDMEFDMKLPPSHDQYGLCVKTSERIYTTPPIKGNVFPYRIAARNFIAPIILIDNDDNYIGAPLTLVKSWSNPYKTTDRVPNKWCLIGFTGESHPLNTSDKNSAKRLKEILKFLSSKIILVGVETDYASYRDGEPISITTNVLNYGTGIKDVDIEFYIIEGDKILFKAEKRTLVGPQEKKEISVLMKPERLQGDFYEVKSVLKVNDKIVDEENNGFTVWHSDRLVGARDLTIKGKYFYQNERPFYLYGINYYESRTGGLMWVRPNILDIEKDISLMSRLGINFLRVHYHHPKWFRDYLEIRGLPLFDCFTGIGKSPLPDERSLRILDAFIILCRKYNIYFQPDLFTLVPEEMGDPEGWIGDLGRATDYEKIAVQKKFIKVLSDRYRNIPNIIWDLWNEPFLGKENSSFLKKWVREIVDAFRSNGDRHLITLGSDEGVEFEDELDFISGHGHEVRIPNVNKPFIVQEIWNESDLSPQAEKRQAEKLRKDFAACIDQGGAGFVPWQWTRQSCLWDDASNSERWDDELGLCVREDRSLKPAGKLYMNLIRDLQ